VEARNMVCVHLLVVADVGDPGAVRRDGRISVRPSAIGERFDLERCEVYGVNLAVVAQVFGFGFADAGDVDGLAVGRPVEAALESAVIVFAASDLARRAAERRVNDEDVCVAPGHGAAAVGSPRQAVDYHGGGGPVRRRPAVGGCDWEGGGGVWGGRK